MSLPRSNRPSHQARLIHAAMGHGTYERPDGWRQQMRRFQIVSDDLNSDDRGALGCWDDRREPHQEGTIQRRIQKVM